MLERMCLPAIVVIVSASSFGLAQTADPSTYVRQVHRQYLEREPSAYELQYWVDQLNRGMSPREMQAFVIASDAYFERNQRNVEIWMSGSLSQVTRRSPTQEEWRYWSDRYRVLNQNRLVWAKELMRWANPSAQGPATAATGSSWTSAPQYASVEDLPNRLVSTAQLLAQSVSTEVTGSSRWVIQLQANSLVTTATSSRDVLGRAGANANDAVAAVEYLERSLDAVHASLNQLGYTTPSSQHYVMQADEILTELRKMYPGAARTTLQLPAPPSDFSPTPRETQRPLTPVVPPTSAPPLVSVAPVTNLAPAPAVRPSGDVSRSIADLQQSCRQLVLLVRARNSREPTYDRLLRDVESMSASVGLFRSNLQYGYALDEQRKHVQDLQRQTAAVNRSLQGVPFDSQLTQLWYDTTAALSVVAADVGLGSFASAAPTQYAVPVNRPTFNGLPFNLPSPAAATSVSTEAIQAIDQAISQCDALMTVYGLYGYYTPGVASLIGELRAERNELTDLRRQASQVPVPSLQSALRRVNDQHRRVLSSWQQVAGAGQLSSAPRVDDLDAAIGRVNQALSWLP